MRAQSKLLPSFRLAKLLISAAVLSVAVICFQFLPDSSQLFSSPALAQDRGIAPGESFSTNPKPRTSNITATVPDNLPPSIPILISPENNSFVNSNALSYVWEGSTDDNGMSHYQFFLDGVLVFDLIPLIDTIEVNYTLTYDPVLNQYTLTPNTVLTDGSHTWKIQAVDVTDNIASSATWTFTIDTLAPTFVLNQIGTADVSISAQDPSSVPEEPIQIDDNEPVLKATGEALSTVYVTLTIPNISTDEFTTTIGSNGQWELQLGVLPRDVEMRLGFIIVDRAGNISALSNVWFIIVQEVIVIPPTSPSPGAFLDPDASPPPGVFEIPITPARETIIRTFQNLYDALPSGVQQSLQNIAPISAVVVSSALPFASLIAIAAQFGWQFSLNLLLKVLQALGFFPGGKAQGLVYDTESDEGVAFAVLTVTNVDVRDLGIKETVITDVYGIYRGIHLPPGEYRVEVSHQDYRFPTRKRRAPHLSIHEFYRGEPFNVDEKSQPLFLIPVDPLKKQHKRNLKKRLRVWLAQTSRLNNLLIWPLFIISTLIVIVFPTIWNILVFLSYIALFVYRGISWFKVPIITGVVLDSQGVPQENVAVRIAEIENNNLSAVLTTNSKGEFRYYGPKRLYQLSLNKQGYVWAPDGSPLSLFEVDVRTQRYHLVATLTTLEDVYKDLLS